MPVIAPPTLTPAGLSPDRADRPTFVTRSIARDDFIKNTQIPELQLALNNVYNNATETYNNAVTAESSANAATAATGVTKWVTGTTYAEGVNVWSPIDFLTYRRKIAGAGATDPSSDSTNWNLITTALDAYTPANILGTVSQSAGVPTGAIIETATNANGTYTKWADGTMICRGTSPTGTTVAAGSNAYAAQNFPAAFIANPNVVSAVSTSQPHRYNSSAVSNATGLTMYIGDTGAGGTSAIVTYVAVGRWFA